jgi:hypothetical protein
MNRAVLERTTRRVLSARAHARRTAKDDVIRWILSRPVPRELLIDILRAGAEYDRSSLVADAHAAHIRALRRRGRRRDESAELRLSDPWSRRVPTVVVDADEYQSLLDQVHELHRLSDEVTRLSERLDANERIHVV